MSLGTKIGIGLIAALPASPTFADVTGILTVNLGHEDSSPHPIVFEAPNIDACKQVVITAADSSNRLATLTCIDQESGATNSFTCKRDFSNRQGSVVCRTPGLRNN